MDITLVYNQPKRNCIDYNSKYCYFLPFQLSNHKIPKEPQAEYTLVETPLDIPMKIEPGEVKKEVNVEELTTEEALRYLMYLIFCLFLSACNCIYVKLTVKVNDIYHVISNTFK